MAVFGSKCHLNDKRVTLNFGNEWGEGGCDKELKCKTEQEHTQRGRQRREIVSFEVIKHLRLKPSPFYKKAAAAIKT